MTPWDIGMVQLTISKLPRMFYGRLWITEITEIMKVSISVCKFVALSLVQTHKRLSGNNPAFYLVRKWDLTVKCRGVQKISSRSKCFV